MGADRLEAFRARLRTDPTAALRECGVPAAYLAARLADFAGLQLTPPGPGGLFLTGDAGTGKTHLAVAWLAARLPELATADELGLVRGPEALWVMVPQVLQELRCTFNARGGETEADVTRRYTRPKLLVLDDLGAEQSSDWTGQALYLIVSLRANNLLPTIVTSNLSLKALDARDPRLASRLGGLAYQRLKGTDRRLPAAAPAGLEAGL